MIMLTPTAIMMRLMRIGKVSCPIIVEAAIANISAERMKSVFIAPLTLLSISTVSRT